MKAIENKDLAIAILESYYEYLQLGYPKDPTVYVIQAAGDTLSRMKTFFDRRVDFLPEMKLMLQEGGGTLCSEGSCFQVKTNDALPEGTVLFGPEQLSFSWGRLP